MKKKEMKGITMQKPLADQMRPETIEDVVGQGHLLAPGMVLRRLIESGAEINMLFYGPSGTGKTTVANIIARQTHKTFYRLNATTASLRDVKDILADTESMMAGINGALLYLDEIQYFNKKQQQSLLEYMEDGRLTLIASTTENPFFYVYGALLSRSAVFEFKAVPPHEIEKAVLKALKAEQKYFSFIWEETLPRVIADSSGGDVRKAINTIELLVRTVAPTKKDNNQSDKKTVIPCLTKEDIIKLSQPSAIRYDKGGDSMYDAASALMKSLRGSDPDAALHYLARFLEVGDLITPCRRLLCSASEDVGMAYPQAITIVKACVDTALQLGLPEAQLPLAQAAILLATAPKSNSVVKAISQARKDIQLGKAGDIPRQLQNVHADTTGTSHEQNYLYPHSYLHHWVEQQYLPDSLKDVKYYEWGDNKIEQAARAYWKKVKG